MEFKLAESNSELRQILALQNKNHFDNLSPESKNEDGFVTVKHDFNLLLKMNEESKQIIAVDSCKVIGYALVMLKKHKNLIPVLTPMFHIFENIKYNNTSLSAFKYYIIGQVCVAKEYRGKGVFKNLYQKHKQEYSKKFECCLTEVSSSNSRSMKAHLKVGFKTIHTFKDETDKWNILLWDWK